jgi:hypothetical protein
MKTTHYLAASLTVVSLALGGWWLLAREPQPSGGPTPHRLIGLPFPGITCLSLAGDTLTFPDAAMGKPTLLVVAFEQQAQSQADSWRKPWQARFGLGVSHGFFELPVINTFWRPVSGWIDGGMRSGIPAELHPNVATYYGPRREYYKALGAGDRSLAYAYLLDSQGIVRFAQAGFATPQSLTALLTLADTLAAAPLPKAAP